MKKLQNILFLTATIFLANTACISCSESNTDNSNNDDTSTVTKCTVTFETNGGSLIDSQFVDYNTTAIEPIPPTKDGYNFADWYLDTNLTDIWNFENLITVDIELYAKWDEIDNDGYMAIRTLSDLKEFRDLINSGNSYINASLESDIDLNGEEWTPIGNNIVTAWFGGVFNGNNYTISNLSIDNSSTNQGLFGIVSEGTISNLILKDCQINGGGRVGAICGHLYDSVISNCKVESGTISGTSDYIGGIVGITSNTSITDCVNMGDVQGLDNGNYFAYIGGVVGKADYAILTNCYNMGIVSSESDKSSNIGGIVGGCGTNSSVNNDYFITINSCYNTGSCSGANICGGIIGKAGNVSTIITESYNTGEISGDGYIGAIVGYIDYSEPESYLTNCYNTGSVSGMSCIGGLIGAISSSNVNIYNCYNLANITGSSINIGGLIGSVDCLSNNSRFIDISNCYNTGNVASTYSSNSNYVGGLIGTSNYTSISNCYNTGNVSGTGSIGGIVGKTQSCPK